MVALKWSNVDMHSMQVSVTQSFVRNRLGNVKTKASGKPVPLYGVVCTVLNEWRRESLYDGDDDFIFPSIRLLGKFPLMPDMVLQKLIDLRLSKNLFTIF